MHDILDISIQNKKLSCFHIRVQTCYYSSDNGIHSRKDVKILKRKSDKSLIEYFFDDVSMSGVDCLEFKKFLNLDDGEYKVTIREWGRSDYYSDDYEYEYVFEKI